jgi:hypothetical protein
VSSLRTKKGRDEASKKFQLNLSKDERYELVNGQLELKPEVKIKIIERNIDYMLSKGGEKIKFKNYHIMNSLISLMKAKSLKIRRDYAS